MNKSMLCVALLLVMLVVIIVLPVAIHVSELDGMHPNRSAFFAMWFCMFLSWLAAVRYWAAYIQKGGRA